MPAKRKARAIKPEPLGRTALLDGMRVCAAARRQVVVLVWNSDKDVGDVAVEGLTYQIKVLQIDPVGYFVVQVIYRRWPDPRLPSEISLCPPPLAKPSGQ